MDGQPGTGYFEDDRRHLLHPFAEFPASLENGSRFFARGEGAWIHDSGGKRFLDGIGGLWCVNIGYGRQEMVRAIAEQAAALPYYNTFTDMSSEPAATLAAKLSELAPGDLNRVFFTTGGSLSVDTAVRLAHYYFQARGRPSKKLILARRDGYHGSTYLAASISGSAQNLAGFHHLAGGESPLVHHLASPNLYRAPAGLSEAGYLAWLIAELEARIAELGAENIACFVAEPIIGAGGVLIAPRGYHRAALEVCRKNDILYVCDEVVTGFGRLGWMFSSEPVFDICPDLIVCAKGISSGYIPLGAVIFSERIFECIAKPNPRTSVFSHGFTYSGHPVACAAGLANLEILEREDLCGRVRALAPEFKRALASLASLEIVGDVRGEGFMHAIEFVADKAAKRSFDSAVGIGKRVADAAFHRGLIARNVGDLIILSPPLILTGEQIDELAQTLHAAIRSVMEDLRRESLWDG